MTERDYQYDVFISYCNYPGHTEWVVEVFLEAFRDCLTNSESLGRPSRVYLAPEANRAGDKWKLVLREALAGSRIMVPIWTIQYFMSEYCRGELAVMINREQRLGYLTDGRKGSLIVPVQFMDGGGYPEIANEYQQEDFKPFNAARKGCKSAKLRKKIEAWAEVVGERVNGAPDWDPAWAERDWIEAPILRMEESRALWPPKAICHFESMGWGDG